MNDDHYFSSPLDTIDEAYDALSLKLDDSRILQMVDKALEDSISHWNQWPYNLEAADRDNLKYWLGEQMQGYDVGGRQVTTMGNRMQTSSRAVLAYVNAQVAKPEVAPSTGSETAKQFARDLGATMHQHGIDNDLEVKAGKAAFNLVIRKRGYLKLRFDPSMGPHGDVRVEHINPEDIVEDQHAAWGEDAPRIWHKQTCTIEELVLKFPDKKQQIYEVFEIGRGVYSQTSRRVTYWECWFTFYDEGQAQEGLCWYLPKGRVVLGKILNPNWIYTGDPMQDRMINYTATPMKPFIRFSYMNSGKGAIDETSLFEQVKVLQDLYNKRRRQIFENNDYINGRTVMDARAVQEGDADKFLSKNPKAILLIKPEDGATTQSSVFHIPHNPLPAQSTEEAYDLRNEIDTGMGTPNIFRGEQSTNNTLGQDERIIEQAGALQDDLARAIDKAMQTYYRKLFQMMKVYYTEDHWFAVRGDDGKYDHVVMQSDNMDTNCKVSVEGGSTLPQDKKQIRDIAVEASNANKIDSLSFWEAIVYGKLPDPETIVERLQKELNDPTGFMMDVEKQGYDRDAGTDIIMLSAGKEPPAREEYGQPYLEYFNRFIMSNKYLLLPEETQEAIKIHLAMAGAVAARTANLQATQVDDAAMAGVPEQQVAEVMQ